MQSEKLGELAAAMVAVQSELTVVVKDSSNPHFKSTFASLEAVIQAASSVLPKHGLCVVQTSESIPVQGYVQAGLKTTIIHTSGQFISGVQPLFPVKNDPQALASAMTYARRYGLMSILGLGSEDDDGYGATGDTERSQAPGVVPGKKPFTASGAYAGNVSTIQKPQVTSTGAGTSLENYVIPAKGGPFAGKTFGQVGPEGVMQALNDRKSFAASQGWKSIGKEWIECENAANQFLAQFNGDATGTDDIQF